MYRHEQIKGLPVVAMREGATIGIVDALVVNPDNKQVRWLSVNSGGRFYGRHWVSIDRVLSLDERGVKINGVTDILGPKEAWDAEVVIRAGRRLIGNQAVTVQGQVLGIVRDYEFDPSTWTLTQVIIADSDGMPRNALSVDADHLLNVREDTCVIGERNTQLDQVAANRNQLAKPGAPRRGRRWSAALAALWQNILPFAHH